MLISELVNKLITPTRLHTTFPLALGKMEENAYFAQSERTKFTACFNRLIRFVYRDEDQIRTDLNVLLDELNSVEYSLNIVKTEEANHLFVKLCSLVPLHQERLLVKLCQGITNIRNRQAVQLSSDCIVHVTDYLIQGIQRCQPWALADLLRALARVVKENVSRLSKFFDALLGEHGILVQLSLESVTDEDLLLEAVQCLENLTIKVMGEPYLDEKYASSAFAIFLQLLHHLPHCKMEAYTQCKVLLSVLRGIQNIILGTKVTPTEHMGPLLAGVRAYIFHGLISHPVVIPDRLYPTPLSQYDASPTVNKTISSPQKEEDTKMTQGSKEQSSKKSKRKKSKKNKEGTDAIENGTENQNEGPERSMRQTEIPVNAAADGDFYPAWARISSSESDYSDTEGGQGSRLRSSCTKVRQIALSCLHSIIKNADKKVIFGFWSSFIPDCQRSASTSQPQTLFTAVIKDPSPKCRMGALAALTALVDGTKPYLAIANDSDEMRMAFVPFSTILGSTIKELHRCLLLALVAENYPLTVTQLIKCIATLIPNVPYHRMRPGLLSRVVKHVRHFINHRDPNVRVACLTCFGAIAGVQPALMEVCHIIQSARPPVGTHYASPTESIGSETKAIESSMDTLTVTDSADSGLSGDKPGNETQSFEKSESTGHSYGHSPGFMTPILAASSSGAETPIFSDPVLQGVAKETSWLVKICSKNVIPHKTGLDAVENDGKNYVEPLPVRLESLQVLSQLTKGYFPIIRNSLLLLQDLICQCLEDTDPVVKLHGAKLLDELTQAMLRDTTDIVNSPEKLNLQKVLSFWLYLLSDPIPTILQMSDNNPVRASACDCLANIGQQVFQELPIDRRILCITLALGLTCDGDKFVRSSAVRVLGVFVLFPIQRQDSAFMIDATNTVMTCLMDISINVRWKAAWSLANICDALVTIREEGNSEILKEIPDALLMKMFTAATKACQDSEKVRSNAVRAMGNILRYFPKSCIERSNFLTAISEGVKALVKNIGTGLMKVRWNACYGVCNIFRNPHLPYQEATWTKDILNVLCTAVKDCKNFKVRINAALALSTPGQRTIYGSEKDFEFVWCSLIGGLLAMEDTTDFLEYRYRDNLSDQICTAILHMVTMVTPADLQVMVQSVEEHQALIAANLDRYRTRPAETNSQIGKCLQQAKDHIATFQSESLSELQKKTLTDLRRLCEDVVIGEDVGMERKQEKSAFVQVYD